MPFQRKGSPPRLLPLTHRSRSRSPAANHHHNLRVAATTVEEEEEQQADDSKKLVAPPPPPPPPAPSLQASLSSLVPPLRRSSSSSLAARASPPSASSNGVTRSPFADPAHSPPPPPPPPPPFRLASSLSGNVNQLWRRSVASVSPEPHQAVMSTDTADTGCMSTEPLKIIDGVLVEAVPPSQPHGDEDSRRHEEESVDTACSAAFVSWCVAVAHAVNAIDHQQQRGVFHTT